LEYVWNYTHTHTHTHKHTHTHTHKHTHTDSHLPVIQAPLPISTFAEHNKPLDIILAAPVSEELQGEQMQDQMFRGHLTDPCSRLLHADIDSHLWWILHTNYTNVLGHVNQACLQLS